MKTKNTMGIYIHIPFCIKKCNYCDFLSFSADETLKSAYVDALIKRIDYYGKIYGNYHIPTVFIGGGTPSVLPYGSISRIMTALRTSFLMEDCKEITIECNPGTTDRNKLTEYNLSGINRLSFGLQSANNDELSFIGRIHTYEDFLKSFDLARQLGFNNINIDLMSALPYQTLSSYSDTLNKVLCLKPEHISAYSLILEEGTPMYNIDKSLLPDEDTEREMYYMTDRLLSDHGYHRYEISNYSLPSRECIHNSSYWTRENYLGIGLGASSLMRLDEFYEGTDIRKNIRFCETSSISDFCSNPEMCNKKCFLSIEEAIEEFMFLGLRLTKGINENNFYNTFKMPVDKVYGNVLKELSHKNLIVRENGFIRLTPLGIDVSNYALSEFIDPVIN